MAGGGGKRRRHIGWYSDCINSHEMRAVSKAELGERGPQKVGNDSLKTGSLERSAWFFRIVLDGRYYLDHLVSSAKYVSSQEDSIILLLSFTSLKQLHPLIFLSCRHQFPSWSSCSHFWSEAAAWLGARSSPLEMSSTPHSRANIPTCLPFQLSTLTSSPVEVKHFQNTQESVDASLIKTIQIKHASPETHGQERRSVPKGFSSVPARWATGVAVLIVLTRKHRTHVFFLPFSNQNLLMIHRQKNK